MMDTTNRGYRRRSVTSIVTRCTVFSIGTTERAQRDHELKIAAQIQRALLPQSRQTRARQRRPRVAARAMYRVHVREERPVRSLRAVVSSARPPRADLEQRRRTIVVDA